MRELIAGSTLIDATDRVQDAYSLRAAPQVLGAVQDSLAHVRSIVERELNAATDNPLIFLDFRDENKALSGGNFHGEPLALALSFLSIAAAERPAAPPIFSSLKPKRVRTASSLPREVLRT